ncbi:TMEM175 family protein [Brevundimonas staleyi]|uniref:TMEM175 family protein n=1 Tax=Brevundimonas staleyi TaxID=74326 RepID=A0ABW0FUU1_9CAUL
MTDVIRTEMARRLDAFVDAAFAFAVTLLVAGGGDPPASLADMQTMLLSAPSYAAAFALTVMFWLSYRDLGRLWPLRDGLSTALSLALVFVVLLYVFPLRLILSGVSLVSVVIALTAPDGMAEWAPGFTYMSVPVLIGVTSFFQARAMSRAAKVDTETAAP